jgi:glycosyltransferase involved in cell wall biosynthesis
MHRTPDISLIVSSFERPSHLLRCLHSIAAQKADHGRIEVVVADDGSRDETQDAVRKFARTSGIAVKFTSHRHDGFRLAQCRNEGVLASTAEYLLFTDGDCVLPSDHVSLHLRYRRRGCVMAGSCYRLDAEASDRLSLARIQSGDLFSLVAPREARRVYWKSVRAKGYEFLRLPMRPRLPGGNMGVWRADFEQVNGFDENFVGWGMEDKDFQRRLESVGIRCIFTRTRVYHLWHPRHPTYSHNSLHTATYRYYHRAGRLKARCERGLSERRLAGFVCNTLEFPLSHASEAAPKQLGIEAEV